MTNPVRESSPRRSDVVFIPVHLPLREHSLYPPSFTSSLRETSSKVTWERGFEVSPALPIVSGYGDDMPARRALKIDVDRVFVTFVRYPEMATWVLGPVTCFGAGTFDGRGESAGRRDVVFAPRFFHDRAPAWLQGLVDLARPGDDVVLKEGSATS